MSKFLPFFLALVIFSTGCARKDFFQKTALVQPAAGKPALTSDSAYVTIGRHYKKGGFHNFFFGKHYRELWATPVTLPVFKMDQAAGGLKPVSLGGGFQTTSLTLQNKEGRPYVLRSIDKDPVKTLPPFLRNTFLTTVLRDQTSAGNPFAPLAVPELSKAAGIYYSSPKFYYVAENDSSFGKFGQRIRGKVMLLEEKYDGKQALTPMFGQAENLLDSEDVLKDHFRDNKHQFDQQLFARARLFDVLIGDWDRHEGQWQWAAYKKGDTYSYQAIPKDRDQTFYVFNDGLITRIASSRFLIRKFQTFESDFNYIPGWLFNARFIDDRALNEVTRADWKRHAEEIKASLTDAVIEKAFENWPKPVKEKIAAKTIKNLKARRDNLTAAADEIYLYLAKEVLVTGSDEDEIFEVKRLPSGETEVLVFRENDKSKMPFYARIFNPDETKELNIYCLGGNDEIKISGKAKRSIELNVYGGEGEDELDDQSEISGGKATTAYDTNRGMIVEPGKEVKKRFKRDVAVHAFDREGL